MNLKPQLLQRIPGHTLFGFNLATGELKPYGPDHANVIIDAWNTFWLSRKRFAQSRETYHIVWVYIMAPSRAHAIARFKRQKLAA